MPNTNVLYSLFARDKIELEEKPKVRSEISILNGFHVEPDFLERFLSRVSYDDKIGVPFNRIQYSHRSFRSCRSF